MKVVFAKHPDCTKEFLFMVPDGMKNPEHGDVMLVDTMLGETIAVASSAVMEIDNVEELVNRCGAYMPLKKVLGVCGKKLRCYIEREVRKSIVCSIEKMEDAPNAVVDYDNDDDSYYGYSY